jgi:hypothetical protein
MPQQASGRTTVTVWNGLVSVRPLGADLPWVGPPQRRRVTVANGTFVGSVPVQLVDSETLAQLDRETRIYTLPKVFMERLRETMQARDQARRTGGQAVAQANPLMPPAAGLAAGVDASAVPAHVEEEDDVAGPEKAAADTEDETADVEIITPAATNDDATSEDVVEDTGNVPAQEDETAEAADDVVADDMLMPLPPMAEETDDAASEDAAEEAGDDVEDDAAAEVEDAADAAEEDEEDSAEPVKEDEEDGFGEWQIPLMPAEE